MSDARGMRVALVLATSTGGVGQHVRSLAAGLAAAGAEVTVLGPAATEELFGFTGVGAGFEAVEIAAGPRPAADLAAVRRLRALIGAHAETAGPTTPAERIPGPAASTGSGGRPDAGSAARPGAEVTGPAEVGNPTALIVHAHGLRAGLLTGLALGRRRPGRTPLVVTWHNAILGGGPKRLLLTAMERRVARGADLTLGASGDLVDRARALGAGDARLAPVSAPPLPPPTRTPAEVRANLGTGDRPVLLAIGRLAPQKGYHLLLDAAAAWTGFDPEPLLLIAGDGPLGPELQVRAAAEHLPVRLLGHRADVPDLLGAADLVVLPSVWEARALVAQEALRAGRPLVATAVGGIPDLVGDAAVLVPPGDATLLADAVAGLLASPEQRERLARLGPEQAATWPDDADTVRQALSVYEELAAR